MFPNLSEKMDLRNLLIFHTIIWSLLRFDPLCGEFNDKLFKESYQFVNEVKSRELVELKKQLKTEEDKERREEVDINVNEMLRLHVYCICNFKNGFLIKD